MNDLMIDLETLSTEPNACILSIGSCFFDLETGVIGDNFYTVIDYQGFNNPGHISLSTVYWWLQQPATAANEIIPGNAPSLPATTALLALNSFIYNASGPLKLWSNGASFDLVILRNAFKRYCIKDTWNYPQERDVRTIVDLCRRLTGIDPKSEIEFDGTPHKAVDDAIHQAKYVSHAYKLISQHGSLQ